MKTKVGDKMIMGDGKTPGLGSCGGFGQKKCRSDKEADKCTQGNYECILRDLIDQEMDPFNGIELGSPVIEYIGLSYEAYDQQGYDLNAIAELGINNPMTSMDFSNAGVPIEWIESMNPSKRTSAQAFFLNAMRLDTGNITNYEHNYLSAVMNMHPDQLALAKQNYYNALLDVTGSAQHAVELFMVEDSLKGTEINE